MNENRKGKKKVYSLLKENLLYVIKLNLGLFCQLRVIVYAPCFQWCRVDDKGKFFLFFFPSLSLSDALDSSSGSKEL